MLTCSSSRWMAKVTIDSFLPTEIAVMKLFGFRKAASNFSSLEYQFCDSSHAVQVIVLPCV